VHLPQAHVRAAAERLSLSGIGLAFQCWPAFLIVAGAPKLTKSARRRWRWLTLRDQLGIRWSFQMGFGHKAREITMMRLRRNRFSVDKCLSGHSF
jgi:hypothetical protein